MFPFCCPRNHSNFGEIDGMIDLNTNLFRKTYVLISIQLVNLTPHRTPFNGLFRANQSYSMLIFIPLLIAGQRTLSRVLNNIKTI